MLADLPKDCGIPPGGITRFCDQIEAQDLRVNSLIIMHDGRKLVEVYRRPYDRRFPQLLFSLSNLFLSAAVGIACDSGFLSLEDRVVSFFPDKLPAEVSPYQHEIRVRHLLSMNTGHHDHNFHVIHPQRDWVKAFLAIPPTHEPGTHYCYSKHASHVLAAIVERTTGQSLVDFLRPRLFGPLGVTEVQWETSPTGVSAGGMGLSIPTEGVARFGQMLLDRGVYDGHRLISEEYLDPATTKQSLSASDSPVVGYGYHVQLYHGGCFGHEGSFGQLCFVAPAERVVVAVTSAKSNFRQIAALIYRYLLGHVTEQEQGQSSAVHGSDSERGITAHCTANADLLPCMPGGVLAPSMHDRALSPLMPNDALGPLIPDDALTPPIPDGALSPPIPDDALSPLIPDDGWTATNCTPPFTRADIKVTDNSEGIQRVVLIQSENRVRLEIVYQSRPAKVAEYGVVRPLYSSDVFVKDVSLHMQPVVRCARMCSATELELVSIYPETPYIATYRMSFEGAAKATIGYSVNVSLEKFSPASNQGFELTGERVDEGRVDRKRAAEELANGQLAGEEQCRRGAG